jgi:alginate O-acetyltransferase complex protein AlgI
MVFSSIEFLWFFFPAVLIAYMAVPPRGRNALLALASLVFYAWGARSLLFLFLGSIAMNYVAGLLIGRLKDGGRERDAARLTGLAVAANLALLFTWKYTVFAVTQLDHVLGTHKLAIPHILLPIGISFFTFHGISYVVDVKRGQARPMRHVADYAQYMAFFPQLIAGPIVRYHQIEDQIRSPPPRAQRWDDIAEGFPRFALGLCKKVLIADQVSPIADTVFGTAWNANSTAAWLGALAYTVQIYFDFSGYSDMAIGMARMFGFRFPENFDRPYSSVSITDFWRRWHMTLSRWFRDYVYIPLGGNRGTQARTVRNLLFVFLLTGAWHGAAWTFVIWGLYNGGLIVAERLTGVSRWADDRWALPRRFVTFGLVVVGWVLFRSPSLSHAKATLHSMVSFNFAPLPDQVHAAASAQPVLALCIGLASVLLPRTFVAGRVLTGEWRGAALAARFVVIAVLPLAAITIAAGSFSPFLYFQF